MLAVLSGCHRSSSSNDSPLPVQKELWKEFSGEKAFEYTKAQIDFGPRPAGSEALAKTRDYLVENLDGRSNSSPSRMKLPTGR
jgi:hypothetical protein